MKLSRNNKKILITGGLLIAFLLIAKKTGMINLVEQRLKTFLPPWEGFSSVPYWDVKQWSWGYGTRVPGSTDNPNIKPTGTITRELALLDAIKHAENYYLYLEPLIKVPLTVNQWAAYLSFSYNLGRYNADNLTANINARDFTALETQWKKYIYADGVPNQQLINRRAAEWQLFVS
jgi:lysozyme